MRGRTMTTTTATTETLSAVRLHHRRRREHASSRARRSSVASASTSSESSSVELSDGTRLEVRVSKPATPAKDAAPLVFVHGSYHAAWCFDERFVEYFNDRGRITACVSLRAHGASERPKDPKATVAGSLERHAEDIAEILERDETLRGCERPAVLFGHSFGGLVAQRCLADGRARVSGLGLLASVPPSGNSEMVKRFLKRDLWASLKITYAFITKAFGRDPALCRECFFSPDLSDADAKRFASLIDASSTLRMLDLKALNASLPVPKPQPGTPNASAPVLVLGGDSDFVVDREGLDETAKFYDTDAVVLPRVAHDVMLDVRWRDAADAIHDWLVANNL